MSKVTINGFTHCETRVEARQLAGIKKTAKIGKWSTSRHIWKDEGSVGYWASKIATENPKLSIEKIINIRKKVEQEKEEFPLGIGA